MNEEYSVGYSEGYQAGWNAAMDATPPAAPVVQEPVAWMDKYGELYKEIEHALPTDKPLYTTAANRQWAGLTTEEMATCIDEPSWDLILRKAEQILKEKNT